MTGQNVRYETIYPNKPSVYSKEVCDRIQTPWLSGEDSEDEVEEDLDGGAVLAEQVTSIDDEDRVDSVDHLSSGVRDILITGKVSVVVYDRRRAHVSPLYTDEPTARRGMGPLHYYRQGK